MRPMGLQGINARALLPASVIETWVTALIKTGDRLPPPRSRVDANGGLARIVRASRASFPGKLGDSALMLYMLPASLDLPSAPSSKGCWAVRLGSPDPAEVHHFSPRSYAVD